MIKVPNDRESQVFSFVRENEKDKVFVVINFSDQSQNVNFKESLYPGIYTDFFSNEQVELPQDLKLTLEPWSYKVFVK